MSREKPDRTQGPDFSHLDSKEKVAAALEAGELEKLFLLPLEFGGEDIPLNVVHVPVGVAALKASFDANVIRGAIVENRVSRYLAQPEYQGASLVPISIQIRAWDPGELSGTIDIWGDALDDE